MLIRNCCGVVDKPLPLYPGVPSLIPGSSDSKPWHVPYGPHREVPYGPQRKKTCLWGFANNTGAEQPAHPGSLISAFVIRFLESVICKLATGEISIF